ncbi:MAG: tetratricopeptide repeat protein [Holophagales bacterium]|nr:tetratricopeptide repeat protein [Holophagales bacterium]
MYLGCAGVGGCFEPPAPVRPASGPHRSSCGGYRILRLLGEGGTGAVYLAEQHSPVARQVALEVVHTSLRTPQVIGRFHAERNALARLAHANIAALHEAGTTLAPMLDNPANVHAELGEHEEARHHFGRALAIHRAALGPESSRVGLVLLEPGTIGVPFPARGA